jgi:DNA-binding response OmpR family regulator
MSHAADAVVVPSAWPAVKSYSPKVLIVDNDEDVLIALERALENEGFETATAVSLEGALQLLAENAFAALVLDDYLSDHDAIGVLTELRHCELAPAVVVVTYHRTPSPGFQARLRLLGAGALVDKCACLRLVQSLRRLLQNEEGENNECLLA